LTTCAACGAVYRPGDELRAPPRWYIGRRGQPEGKCAACRLARNREVRAARAAARARNELPVAEKQVCVACRTAKLAGHFAPAPGNPSGLDSTCKECRNAARAAEQALAVRRARRKNNPEKAHAIDRRGDRARSAKSLEKRREYARRPEVLARKKQQQAARRAAARQRKKEE
jgi:hypothetical protein